MKRTFLSIFSRAFCKVLVTAHLVVILAAPAGAQINMAFIRHLSENHLQREHFAYLSQAGIPADSLHYLEAKYYLQYANDSLFLEHYSAGKTLFLNDSNASLAASIHFLNRPRHGQESWFGSLPAGSGRIQEVKSCYLAGLDPLAVAVQELPSALRPDLLAYKKYYGRKPWVAGALSAALPGAGKLYAGRPHSFYFTLASHLVYGVQSYESIQKLGVSHPFSIFSMGLLGVFYVANIYGSYHAVKQVKEETKKRFLLHAEEYYHFNYGTSFY